MLSRIRPYSDQMGRSNALVRRISCPTMANAASWDKGWERCATGRGVVVVVVDMVSLLHRKDRWLVVDAGFRPGVGADPAGLPPAGARHRVATSVPSRLAGAGVVGVLSMGSRW
jgi:hypothetical protein